MNKNKGCQISEGTDDNSSNEGISGRKKDKKYSKKQKKIGAKEQRVLEPNMLVKECARVEITLYPDE